MIRQAIDRSRPTGGGMAVSCILHGGLLLLLIVTMGRQAAELGGDDPLTEIAYIEARYGEDVAAKVKLREKLRRPEPPGMGVSTDSAVKQAREPEATPGAAPRPEPRAALAQAAFLPRSPELPTRTAVTQVAAPEMTPAAIEQPALAEALPLQARTAPPPARRIIDPSKLAGDTAGLVAEARATPTAQPMERDAFVPRAGGALDARRGALATGEMSVAAATRPQSDSVVEAPATLGQGGSLQGRGRAAAAPAGGASLQPADRDRSGTTGGQGVVDVAGPSGGGGAETGRKTVLDYGSGGGGRGGGLAGRRTRLVEPATSSAIAAGETGGAPAASRPQEVVEAVTGDQGVGMTISGQIKGRNILHRVAPAYSREARRNGWEGMVSVHFTVLADGRVKDNVYFEQTSVHRDLNRAAMEAIKQFRFAPLPAEQAAVEQWGVITIVFRLS
ncbi:MAG: TonB family protein [Candidatus Krumholzibacteriia bacterium]